MSIWAVPGCAGIRVTSVALPLSLAWIFKGIRKRFTASQLPLLEAWKTRWGKRQCQLGQHLWMVFSKTSSSTYDTAKANNELTRHIQNNAAGPMFDLIQFLYPNLSDYSLETVLRLQAIAAWSLGAAHLPQMQKAFESLTLLSFCAVQ